MVTSAGRLRQGSGETNGSASECRSMPDVVPAFGKVTGNLDVGKILAIEIYVIAHVLTSVCKKEQR